MSNNRYLEFDSSYRNRIEWPLAGEFEIPISQTGRKSKENALDPVCLGVPIQTWTSNNLDCHGNPSVSGTIVGTVPPVTIPPISASSFSECFIIQTSKDNLQRLRDYYLSLTIVNSMTGSYDTASITEYSYLYTDNVNDYGKLITTGLNFIPGDSFIISDPTDLTSTLLPYFFIPDGRIPRNSYLSYLLYNETLRQSRQITLYDLELHVLRVDTTGPATPISGLVTGWSRNDNYSIRKEYPNVPQPGGSYYTIYNGSITYQPPTPPPPAPPVAPPPITFTSSSSIIIFNNVPSITPENFYKNCALRLVYTGDYNFPIPQPYNESRTINKSISFTTSGVNYLVIDVYPSFTSDPTTISDLEIEILNFSYDNFNPFVYTGSLVSQQEMVCYEIELLNVVLPNETLTVGAGGRIAFYQYVYVELSNVSASGSGLKNIIYSNNPNATTATFRAPIDDIPNPLISSFIKLDGNGMVQTIKFKPNDNLYFSVRLSNGEIYNTIIEETISPAAPNPKAQISAMFSLRRL